MGHRGLQIKEGDLGPLLSVDDVEALQSRYISTLRNNITEWMSNSMSTDQRVNLSLQLLCTVCSLLAMSQQFYCQ